jgi:ABC-type antimicrobial peptide transport system permease subunit
MYVCDGSPDLTYFRRNINLLVRSSAAGRELPAAVRSAVWEIDSSIPVVHAAMMEDVVARTGSATRFRGVLSLLFAGMALLIGAVGLYGMVSHGVARRQREMGIRLTLGAAPSGLSRLVIRQGMSPVLIGLAAGLVTAPAAGSLLGSLLYGVGVLEPLPYLVGAAALACSALIACVIPAVRAARVDPVEVLRAE